MCYSKAISRREMSNFVCMGISVCHNFSFFSKVFIIINEYSNLISLITTHKVRVLSLSITLILILILKDNYQVRYE